MDQKSISSPKMYLNKIYLCAEIYSENQRTGFNKTLLYAPTLETFRNVVLMQIWGYLL